MAGKFKMTGFARFFVIMFFVAPLAYLGASYYNGQDGIGNIKRFLKIEGAATVDEEKTEDSGTIDLFGGGLRKQVEALQVENKELRDRLSEQEAELEELKREVRLLRRQ